MVESQSQIAGVTVESRDEMQLFPMLGATTSATIEMMPTTWEGNRRSAGK